MGWVANLFKRMESIQYDVFYDIPEEKRKEGYGRAAKLIVDGPEGGIFERWFCEQGVQPKPPEVEIKNTAFMTERTLLDLITPDVDLDTLVALIEETGSVEKAAPRLYPRLDFRTALANGLILISGDKPDVDSEEWAQILDRALMKIAFPIVIRGMLRKAKKKSDGHANKENTG